MKSVSTSLVVSAVLASLAACGGPPGATAPSAEQKASEDALRNAADDPHGNDEQRDGCKGPVDFDGVSHRIEAELNIARRAVCKFRRVEAALDAGFVNTGLPCIPGQGYHYIKNSLVGTTDIREPSVLMYDKDGNLNSPEWVAPLDGFPTPPTIFGRQMHADDDLGLWIQHVWVWKLNPDGVFEDVNPTVTCP
jgi:predicted small lipoprotein YifL